MRILEYRRWTGAGWGRGGGQEGDSLPHAQAPGQVGGKSRRTLVAGEWFT